MRDGGVGLGLLMLWRGIVWGKEALAEYSVR